MLKHNKMQLKLLGEENKDLQDEIKYVRDIVKAQQHMIVGNKDYMADIFKQRNQA